MIRVAIVDDHALVRAGLGQYLCEHVDLRVVAECASAREAMDVVRQEAADVIVLDLSMPGQSGVDALQAIKARAPKLAVLILSSFPEAHERLSERELQVFLRLARGETISRMAEGMALSVKTVSTYRARVMEKMKLVSNSDLTYYALKNGLIQ